MTATNVAVQLTSPGVAAIAVVRLQGPAVTAFLKRHFTAAARPGQAVHGRLVDGQREIDDPLVILNAKSQSADLCLHGGLWVVHELLNLARAAGFTVLPGQSTPVPDLAFDVDSELEREVLTWLPYARTPLAIRALLAQQQAWETLLTSPPATLDFQSILSDHSLWHLLNPPRLAIIGIPNAGKSTLANRLFGQDRSIVADLPGTTRDWVADYANLDGLPVLLLDTPGLRLTDCQIESAAITASGTEIAAADLVILLLDPTQPPDPQDQLALQYPAALRVVGKFDLRPPLPPQWGQFAQISVTNDQGLANLTDQIHAHFGLSRPAHQLNIARIWTQRQRDILQTAGPLPRQLRQLIGPT